MGTNLIEIERMLFRYPAQDGGTNRWSLEIDHLAIPRRVVCRIQGGNMVGKTTLLRILGGLEQVLFSPETKVSGTLLKNSHQRSGVYERLESRNTCFLSHSDRMFPELSIWENVKVARSCGPRKGNEAHQRFRDYIGGLSILQGATENTPLGELSSGGQALIRLARAFTWGAQMVLIDEVTGHLDDASAKTFFQHLRTLVDGDCSVVLVSHDRRDHELAESLVDDRTRIVVALIELKDGRSCVTEHFYS